MSSKTRRRKRSKLHAQAIIGTRRAQNYITPEEQGLLQEGRFVNMSFLKENRRRVAVMHERERRKYLWQFSGLLFLCVMIGVFLGVILSLKVLGYS